MSLEIELSGLLHPPRLYGWADLSASLQLPPKCRGLYAWYFRPPPRGVPTRGCHRVGRWTLLYVGISPSRASSTGSLHSRIRYHYRGNVSGSTLRTSLACLLREDLRARLRCVGSSRTIKLTHEGEARLRRWMAAHARVCWVEHPRPWLIEEAVVASLNLPLNLLGNKSHAFSEHLKALRTRCRKEAHGLPTLQRSV